MNFVLCFQKRIMGILQYHRNYFKNNTSADIPAIIPIKISIFFTEGLSIN